MNKYKAKNESVKRKYLHWKRNAHGHSEKTILAIEKAIWKYEEFTKEDDYSNFNATQAQAFKEYLNKQVSKSTGKILSLSTKYHTLKHIQTFLRWLGSQPGYKSRINLMDIEYLRLTNADTRKVSQTRLPNYPTIAQVVKVCDSIVIKNEVDTRDRAIIAFIGLSGVRDSAAISLKIRHLNFDEMLITQDPSDGVNTKFSKLIYTRIFPFNENLVHYVKEWHNYLIEKKLFSLEDPLFPATKLKQTSEINSSFNADEVDNRFWLTSNPVRSIFKKRFIHAGLKYYYPHKFRHMVVHEAMKYCKTAEQMRAVSQNIGHENIGTTLQTYGKLDPYRVIQIIGELN